MKKVFLESHNLKNPYFGFGQFNIQLIKAFKELPRELQLIIHSPNILEDKKQFGNSFKYKKYFSFRRYENLRIRKKYDLWHSLNQNTKIEPYHKIPYLLTVHNTVFPENKENPTHIRFQEKLLKSNAITYISEFAKTSTHQYFNIPEVPEYVIYNGNPIQKINIPKDFQAKVTPQQPYLFFIGEFAPRKNLKCLVKLIEILPDHDLVLAGKNSTSYGEELKELIQQKKLEKQIHIVGKISDTEKQYYYKNCKAFVFPSLREGFGLPIIEAMFFQKPIFSSNKTSLPEIGQDLVFYWENFEAEEMKSVFENGIESFKKNEVFLKNKLKERAQYFSWKNAAKEYLNVYNELLNN